VKDGSTGVTSRSCVANVSKGGCPAGLSW
jgi:hypothetical protein